MANIFEKCLYLYPDTQGITYWQARRDGTPWQDPYDGLIWEVKDIPKPTKQELDTLDDLMVENTLKQRDEEKRKKERNKLYAEKLDVVARYQEETTKDINLTWNNYLDQLEEKSKQLK